MQFQSRNRGSFDFKIPEHGTNPRGCSSFNLVIEVLLISSRFRHRLLFREGVRFNLVIEVLLISRLPRHVRRNLFRKFQSRNRGSFDFKRRANFAVPSEYQEFQSRNRGSFDFKRLC